MKKIRQLVFGVIRDNPGATRAQIYELAEQRMTERGWLPLVPRHNLAYAIALIEVAGDIVRQPKYRDFAPARFVVSEAAELRKRELDQRLQAKHAAGGLP